MEYHSQSNQLSHSFQWEFLVYCLILSALFCLDILFTSHKVLVIFTFIPSKKFRRKTRLEMKEKSGLPNSVTNRFPTRSTYSSCRPPVIGQDALQADRLATPTLLRLIRSFIAINFRQNLRTYVRMYIHVTMMDEIRSDR